MKSKRGSYMAALVLIALAAGGVRLAQSGSVSTAEMLASANGKLASLPASFGDWRVKSEEPLDASTLSMLKCSGHVGRCYVNSLGEVVNVVLLVGPSGPLLAHLPDVCLAAQDYDPVEPPRSAIIERPRGDRLSFITAGYRARTLEGKRLRIHYAWSTDCAHWKASDTPRLSFGMEPVLYKLQLASFPASVEDGKNDDTGRHFLEQLMTAWDGI